MKDRFHIETSAQRVNDAGLKVTRTCSYSKYPTYDGFTETDRTETFVIEFTRTHSICGGQRRIAAGTRAYIWRTQYIASDFPSPSSGDVSIHGYLDDGRQVISFRSDEEVARVAKSVRTNGKILRAEDDPNYPRAREAYGFMMSR